MYSLKALGKKLSLPPKQLVKDLAIKHRRKLFCKFDGVWYQFKSPNEVIIPAYQAKNYALRFKKNLIDPIDIHDLKLDHLNSNETSKIPVVVLLGHFNHGKTTLLDALGGSKFVDEEKHKITQVVRTQLVSAGTNRRMTIVDTPGQEVFYRMRSYGASIADMALLLIAADDGIGLQTEESIGIVETLSIPTIICINKIDAPGVTDETLRAIEKQVQEYIALEKAPIVQISAKEKINIQSLLERMEELAKSSSVLRSHTTATSSITATTSTRSAEVSQEPSEQSLQDVRNLNITGAGTVLNILKNRQHGSMLHVIVRNGEVRSGDWFSAGGWCGAIRTLQHSTSSSTTTAAASPSNKGSASKKKSSSKKISDSTDNKPALTDPNSATTGMAVTIAVTLHSEVSDPRPLGDTVLFHRDSKKISLMQKQQQSVASTMEGSAEKSAIVKKTTATLSPAATTTTDTAATTDTVVSILPALRVISNEQFTTAKEAAEYCMERGQLAVMLATYAVSPEDASRFRLEKLCSLFERQKPGFHGAAERANIIDIEEEEDAATDIEEEGSAEEECSDEEEEQEEEVSVMEAIQHIKTVIVKADSDITLGTLYDRYEDMIAEVEEQLQQQDRDPGNATLRINQVLHWGIGEVGMKDVNMAKAGDALIIAYNVGIERSAARQALNVNVKIAKHDHIQEASNAIVGDLAAEAAAEK